MPIVVPPCQPLQAPMYHRMRKRRWIFDPLFAKRLPDRPAVLYRTRSYSPCNCRTIADAPAGKCNLYRPNDSRRSLFLHGEELDQHLIYLHSLSDASQYQEAFEKISPHLCEKSIIIIDGIRQEKGIFRVWENFSKNEKIRVTFDLYNLAIAICNPKLNKQNYIVAF